MVDGNLAFRIQDVQHEIDYTYLPDELKYTSVSLKEVLKNKMRLEASSFSIDSKVVKDKIMNYKYGFTYITGENGICKAYRPGIIKRNYVDKSNGIPMYTPSQITELYPKPYKFISSEQAKDLADWIMIEGEMALTCSGTIGNVSMVSRTLKDKVFSQNMIRLYDYKYLGYIYAYFNTNEGKSLISSNNYGAVIQHIDPSHLENIIIPNAPESLRKVIHELIIKSYDLRDESNEMIDDAEQILYTELQLKPIEELKPVYFENSVDLRNYTTKLSELEMRFDGSFHIPMIKQVELALKKNALKMLKLSDSLLTKEITLPGRFSRTYVHKENGVQFLGGRDIFQLNPTSEKYLSKVVHKQQLESDLKIAKNDILTPSRGTIGRVVLAPEHFSVKSISDNIINIKPADENIAGYLFSILNSDYGGVLIKRQIYGGVVDAMEPAMLANIDIPILKDKEKQKEINELVLQANELRYQSYLKEQEAIKKMEDIINNKI